MKKSLATVKDELAPGLRYFCYRSDINPNHVDLQVDFYTDDLVVRDWRDRLAGHPKKSVLFTRNEVEDGLLSQFTGRLTRILEVVRTVEHHPV